MGNSQTATKSKDIYKQLVIYLYCYYAWRMNPVVRLITRAEFQLLVVVLIWGLNFIVMKEVLDQLSPLAFNIIRLTMAAVALLLYMLWKEGWPTLTRNDALKLAGLGILGNTFYHILMMSGLHLSTPELTALFVTTSPIWTTITVAIIGWERIRAMGWIGVGLSFIGAAIVIFNSHESGTVHESELWGNVLALASAAVWGLYTVFSKDLLKRHSPLQMTTLALCVGVLILWPISLGDFLAVDLSQFSATLWLGIIFAGIFSIGFSYVVWAYGVQQIGASHTSVFVNLVPVVTFISAFIFLDKSFVPLQIIGGLIVISGIYLTNRARTAG